MKLHVNGWKLMLNKFYADLSHVFLFKTSGYLAYKRLLVELSRECSTLHSNVIIINGEYNPMVILIWAIARLKGSKVIVTWHDVTPHVGNFLNTIYWFVSFLNVKIVGNLIVHSTKFLNISFLKGLNVYYLPLPLFDFPEVACKSIRKENVVLFFGRIEKYKGIERLTSIFGANRNIVPNIQLEVIGHGSEAYINALGLRTSRSIRYSGTVPDETLAKRIMSCKAVVMPYIHCSQSLNPYWAERYSAPLIISNEVNVSMMLDGYRGCYVFKSHAELVQLLKNVENLDPFTGNLSRVISSYKGFLFE